MPSFNEVVTATYHGRIELLGTEVCLHPAPAALEWRAVAFLKTEPEIILGLFRRGPWLSPEEFAAAATGDSAEDRLRALRVWLAAAEHAKWYDGQQLLTLDELITTLKALPQDRVVPVGFGYAHSYRGDYEHISFSPAINVRVEDMLADARAGNGNSYVGWKGGEYWMDRDTPVHFAEEGCSDEPRRDEILAGLGLAVPA